jgi:aquaporin NIP
LNRSLLRRASAEAAGTAILVALGTGTVVLAVRVGGIAQVEMAIAWFVAVLLPIVLFIDLSGAHLNPAVTLSLAASGRIAWREVPAYLLGQLLGAFAGSAAVLALMGDVDHLGATVPTGINPAWAFLAELLFTVALVAAVFVLADRGEGRGRWRLVLPPLAVAVSTYFIGPWTGSSLNPARTIAPAVLSGTYTDLWVYLIAAPLAALLMAGLWRPRAVDRLDRGPGRPTTST